MIKNFFLDHPEENGMSYLSHLFHASYLGVIMLLGSASLFVHALVPKFFQKTGSNAIKDLYNNILIHEMKYDETKKTDYNKRDVNSID